MDRRWITTRVRRLSTEHTNGVRDFMQFVRLSFADDAYVLCPCRGCLNRETQCLERVEAHLLLYGMASTYDRWIHHGEPLQPAHEARHGGEPEAEHGGDAGAHHIGGGDAEAHYLVWKRRMATKMTEFLICLPICTTQNRKVVDRTLSLLI